MESQPITTELINRSQSRQAETIALIAESPKSRAELLTLTGMKTGNLSKVIEILISKGKIIPNPNNGKYEIYSKKQ